MGYAFGLLKFFKDGCKAAQRVFEVIDRVPEIDPWHDKGKVLKKIEGNLELQNIQFAYPARPNAIIFSDFSLSIPAGPVPCSFPCLFSSSSVFGLSMVADGTLYACLFFRPVTLARN